MPRTLVVSDLHGRIAPLDAALADAGFSADDALVVAGDMIDVGSEDAVGYVEGLGATILGGNHEVAAALGLRISPQNPESLARGPQFAERFLGGEWKLAHAAEGCLVTHAGVSSVLSDIISPHDGDLAAIADDLNTRFRDEMADALTHAPLNWDDLDRYRLIGSGAGPLWFRPWDTRMLPSGLCQVVGHTAPELLPPDHVRALASAGLFLVEPGGHEAEPRSGARVRYAIIEDGTVRVVEN